MTAFLGLPWADVLPWIAVIIVYLGEKIQYVSEKHQQNVTIENLNAALVRAQGGAIPTPTPPALPAPPKALPAPAPTIVATPAPTGPYADCPWVKLALHEIGFHETGVNDGIGRYIAMAHCGQEGDPWCAIFACAMLEQSGVTSPRSASSQSFLTDPTMVPLSQPALGCIVVYWRISKDSGQGHVGFYWGEDATHIWTLGGNENDMVQIERLPKNSSNFGLRGYFWPKGLPLPKGGPVALPASTPVSIQQAPLDAQAPPAASGNAVQTNITATVFGGNTSAYGPAINDNSPGVALPFRFPDPRPRVHVTNVRTGASCDCDIVDVGPWNINDPYWQTGSRPQAESGTDLGQVGPPRHTNGAGIDLTAAAATALGIDGKGQVNWSFIETQTPKVD